MRYAKMFILFILVAFFAGCATAASPLPAWLYTNVKGPIDAELQSDASKEGKACASNILGLIATGDASIDAAKKAGGIKEVSSVDYKSSSVLGLYAQFCTIVRGK
ncbi:MAG: TRL-like family protein [Thermodesulfovibrionales bacterium]